MSQLGLLGKALASWEMALWVEAIALKPDNLNPIPGTHRVERKNQLSQTDL